MSSASLLTHCKLGSHPLFPSKVIIYFGNYTKSCLIPFKLHSCHFSWGYPGVWRRRKKKESKFPLWRIDKWSCLLLTSFKALSILINYSLINSTSILCTSFLLFSPVLGFKRPLVLQEVSLQEGSFPEQPWSCIYCVLLQRLGPSPDFMFKSTSVSFLNAHIDRVLHLENPLAGHDKP